MVRGLNAKYPVHDFDSWPTPLSDTGSCSNPEGLLNPTIAAGSSVVSHRGLRNGLRNAWNEGLGFEPDHRPITLHY